MSARLAFQKIWGVGPKTAAALFQQHGLRTIEELRVRALSTFQSQREREVACIAYYSSGSIPLLRTST